MNADPLPYMYTSSGLAHCITCLLFSRGVMVRFPLKILVYATKRAWEIRESFAGGRSLERPGLTCAGPNERERSEALHAFI